MACLFSKAHRKRRAGHYHHEYNYKDVRDKSQMKSELQLYKQIKMKGAVKEEEGDQKERPTGSLRTLHGSLKEPSLQLIEKIICHRNNNKRKKQRGQETSYRSKRHRRTGLRALPYPDGDRHHT